MTALAADRKTSIKLGAGISTPHPVAASTTIYDGSIVCLNGSGYLVPASDATALHVVGVSAEYVANTGSAGAKKCRVVEDCVAKFGNSAGDDAITQAHVGGPAFVYDDQTIGDGDDAVYGVFAGIVQEIDDDGGIWVKFAKDKNSLIGSGIETVSASGAVSTYLRSSILSVSGTKAYTLAAGLFEGQRKTIYCKTAASTPVGVLTPATFADGTTLTFDAVGECVELEWHGHEGWTTVLRVGATLT